MPDDTLRSGPRVLVLRPLPGLTLEQTEDVALRLLAATQRTPPERFIRDASGTVFTCED